MMIALATHRLFDGSALRGDSVVLIEDGRVAGVLDSVPSGIEAEILPHAAMLAPGFVDLQVNGGGGLLFNDRLDAGGLGIIADAHARLGTTTILPTLISGTRDQLRAALTATGAAIALGVPGIAGLHLEGPFIALARRGIHPAAAVTRLTEADIAMLSAAFPLLLTLAPETAPEGAIARLCSGGAVVFAGHTEAGWEQAQAGLSAGISGFTHLFNAMSQMAGREPGAVGTALANAACYAGIIVDGLHVHPASVRAAWRTKGADRLFLVSDAMPTTGSDAAGFTLNGVEITLRDGKLTDAAGTLAGAHLSMAEAVRNAVEICGIPVADALRMATSTPADCMGLGDRGRIQTGSRADFVILNNDLRVTDVWQGGEKLYSPA